MSNNCEKCGELTTQTFPHHDKSEDRVKQLCMECHEKFLSFEKKLLEYERKTGSKMKEEKQKKSELKKAKKRSGKQRRSVLNPPEKSPERHHGTDIVYKPRRKDTPPYGNPFDY